MDSYRKPGTANNFFDAAILISTGSLFYSNLIWFALLLVIGIALLRTGNFMEIVISIIGLVTPYLITFGLYYTIGKDLKSLLLIMKNNLLGRSEDFVFTELTIVTIIYIGLIFIISVFHLQMLINSKKIKARKTFNLLFWVFLISFGIYFVMPSVSVEIVWLLSIPVSYFLTHYFVFVKMKRGT